VLKCGGISRGEPPKLGAWGSAPWDGRSDWPQKKAPSPYVLPHQIQSFCIKGCMRVWQTFMIRVQHLSKMHPLTPLFLNNSMKNKPILIIFDIRLHEATWHQKNINVLLTSCANSCHTTLEVLNSDFSTIFKMMSIKQLIFPSFP